MACTKQLSLNPAPPTGDFSMDQAIFEPVTGTIMGVRGQWLFQFNATTGAFIQGMRFMSNVGGKSSITALSGKLYIGTTFTPSNNLQIFNPFPDRDVYVVDAATFATVGRWNLGIVKLTFSFGNKHESQYYSDGWYSLVTIGAKVYGYTDEDGIFAVDPTNIPGYTRVSSDAPADIAVDTVNNVLWLAAQDSPDIYCLDTNLGSFNESHDTNGNLNSLSGITYNVAQNKVYAVKGAEDFYMVQASAAMPGFNNFPANTVHTGRINATPYRIKSVNGLAGNPHNGKVLIPTFADDAVIVWNPASDTVESVQTGFTAPVDIVVCPTTNWALQTGVVALKQIL